MFFRRAIVFHNGFEKLKALMILGSIFLGKSWIVSGRHKRRTLRALGCLQALVPPNPWRRRKRRALRALGRQYVSVRPHLAVAPGHSGLA